MARLRRGCFSANDLALSSFYPVKFGCRVFTDIVGRKRILTYLIVFYIPVFIFLFGSIFSNIFYKFWTVT